MATNANGLVILNCMVCYSPGKELSEAASTVVLWQVFHERNAFLLSNEENIQDYRELFFFPSLIHPFRSPSLGQAELPILIRRLGYFAIYVYSNTYIAKQSLCIENLRLSLSLLPSLEDIRTPTSMIHDLLSARFLVIVPKDL